MVRLKDERHPHIHQNRLSFNSLMVRLKVLNCLLVKKTFKGFNSLMVRLKAIFSFKYNLSATEFQFLDGAIKRMSDCKVLTASTSFNSLMVRLKAPFLSVTLSPKWFQFLDGAIKRTVRSLPSLRLHDVSIP